MRKLYSIPGIEALLDDNSLTDTALRSRLRHKISELRSELRKCGFDIPTRYLNKNVDIKGVVALRKQGMTLRAIGEAVGVSGERVRQILESMK